MTANVCVVAASSSMISTRSCRDSMTVTIAGDSGRSQVQYRDKIDGFAHFRTPRCSDRAHPCLTGCVLIIHTFRTKLSALSRQLSAKALEGGHMKRAIVL